MADMYWPQFLRAEPQFLLTSKSAPAGLVNSNNSSYAATVVSHWSTDQSELQVQDQQVITWCLMILLNIYW